MEQATNPSEKCPSTGLTQAEMLESMEGFQSYIDIASLQDLARFNKTLAALSHFGVDLTQKLEEQLRFLTLLRQLQKDHIIPSLGLDGQRQVNAFIKVLNQEREKSLQVSKVLVMKVIQQSDGAEG